MRILTVVMLSVGLVLFQKTWSQCLLPSTEGDTLTPVINRMRTPSPFGAPYPGQDIDIRSSVGRSVTIGDTAYISGNFNYLGPNTGTGVIMSTDGVNVLTAKKWRVNGPVFASAADGQGGFYIAGAFSRVGDVVRYNIAHINSQGIPDSWQPQVNDVVRAMVLKGDTVVIGGSFSAVNGQTRNAFAMISVATGTPLPATNTNNALKPGTVINSFRYADPILYVVGEYNIYNTVGSLFKVDLRTNSTFTFQDAFQLETGYAVEVSEDKKLLYVGGQAGGGPATHNGFCIDIATNNLRYWIDVGVKSIDGRAMIYSLKAYGSSVYAGGLFDFGIVGGNGFTQKGVIAFDAVSAQPRNYLKDCDGIVSYVNADHGKVYIGGEYNVIGGFPHINFAIYDTAAGNTNSNTITVSDKLNTLSFSGGTMFAGGYFQSLGGVVRNGFAAYDYVTGQIKSWTPNFYANSLSKMEAKGDTILMAGEFGQLGYAWSLGGFLAVSATTGNFYSSAAYLAGTGYDILVDSNFVYVGGVGGSYGNNNLVKLTWPGLAEVGTWKPSPGFDVKVIQKKGGTIYCVGDSYASGGYKGYICQVDNATGKTVRTTLLNPPPNKVSDFGWVNAGILVGNKLFFAGDFQQLLQVPRNNFGVFDVSSWTLDSTELIVGGGTAVEGFRFNNGHLYFYGDFNWLNLREHHNFAMLDTTVGAVFPDQLHLNNDYPTRYTLEDNNYYDRLNTVLFVNNNLILGGHFRNVNGKMFPSLAKLKLASSGTLPSKPQGISGAATIAGPSQGNLYTIVNSNPNYRYAWFYTGQNVRIENNGTDSIRLDVGPLASPGVLKSIAMTECGKSDTVYFNIGLATTEPTVNAKNLVVVRKTDTTATVKFTPGNGVRRVVVIRASNTIANLPVDGQEYSANNSYGSGSDLGGSTYVLYKGTGDSVDIKSLSPATVYYVSVIEFNGSDAGTNYLTSNNPVVAFTTYAALPSIPAKAIVFSNKTTNSITINCTPGNGQHRLVVIRLGVTPIGPVRGNSYTASTVFGSGSNLGNGSYVLSTTSTPVTVTGLNVSTTYSVSVFEFNGSDSSTNYLLTPAGASFTTYSNKPTVPASNISFSNITGTGVTINCTPGNGTSRLVVIRKDSAIVDAPVDLTGYTWNIQFGVGSNIGHNTYVLREFTPTDVLYLSPVHRYYVKIFEFNGYDSLANYLVTNAPMDSFTTLPAAPTLQAANLYSFGVTSNSANLSCNSGNGEGRLIVVRKGSPVTDNPVDGTDYNASANFGAGSNIGNNTFVVAKKQAVNVLNLEAGVTYYAKAFEFNSTGANTRYLIANAPTTSFATQGTIGEPTTQASNIVVSNISATSATIDCSSGNGANRLIVIRAGSSITAVPVDGTSYTASTVIGSGSDIGGQTYVIATTSGPVTVSGLTANTDYSIAVFEFNGSGTTTDYLITNRPAMSFHTIATEPTVAAANITITNIGTGSATINCTTGNGQYRLVVIKAGTQVSALPTDGTTYTANTVYGGGSDIGGQTYVISATNTPVTVTGLNANTDFTVRVFEFNGSGSSINYLSAGSPSATFRTQTSEPTVQASGISVTNITINSAVINCTPGNGSNRLVVIKAGNSLASQPVDGTGYNANSVFGSGSDIGTQCYVISIDTLPVTVTGLSPGTEYTVSVFEYNGSGSLINYLATGNVQATFKTLATEPVTQAGGITVSNITPGTATITVAAGSGSGRLIAIKQGTTSTAVPQDGKSYTANTSYGSGSDIGGQTYVVSLAGGTIAVTGLQANTDYTVSGFEFNGTGGATNYKTSGFVSSSFKSEVATATVDFGSTDVTLKVFPNPVTNIQVSLRFKSNRPGRFLFQLFDANGKECVSTSWSMLTGINDRTVNLPSTLPAGVYMVHCNFGGKNVYVTMLKN